MGLLEGGSAQHLSVSEWLSHYGSHLQRNLPRLIQTISSKDPEGLNLTTREVSETNACHLTGRLAREYGVPEGYQVSYDGKLLRFNVESGDYGGIIDPHLFFYKVDAAGQMQILDLFASQAYMTDGSAKGAGNARLRNLAQQAPHLITELGGGVMALHGPAEEIQRVFGLEHVTHQGFWAKYGKDSMVDLRTIPNMFTGLSGQQSGQSK